MENASKALLIAGGFLLMILLLSLMTFVFSNMAQKSSNIYDRFSESDITEFNQKFLQFEDRKLGIQEVVTIINTAKEQNENPKVPTSVNVMIR